MNMRAMYKMDNLLRRKRKIKSDWSIKPGSKINTLALWFYLLKK